jgi:hypothetical protein
MAPAFHPEHHLKYLFHAGIQVPRIGDLLHGLTQRYGHASLPFTSAAVFPRDGSFAHSV